LSKVGGGLLGGKPGEGIGDVLGTKVAGFIGNQLKNLFPSLGSIVGGTSQAIETSTPIVAAITGQTAAVTGVQAASTTAIVGALSALTAVDTATTVKPSFIGTTYALGGIVPSAAGGWALPHFSGMQPAMLHGGEMVLPKHISEGLQSMIGSGGSGDLNLHFHGPSDGPAVERWFTGLMARNPGVVRNMLHTSNTLTPRTI